MAEDDWFRSGAWDENAQDLFRERLKRARDQKWFYLRVKARAIAAEHPEDALTLFAQYIAADPEHWSDGHYAIATIELARGEIDAAFAALDEAMGENGQDLGATGVMENAFLCAFYGRTDRYERALALFEPWDKGAARQFGRPFNRSFAGNYGEALMLHALGRVDEAQLPARAALEQQLSDRGPVAGHPALGIPPRASEEMMRQLVWIAGLWDSKVLGDPPTRFAT
ncbi:hypothetical protein [Croceicoccus bisphenolivorans]|uniref:hypothetical protein n=1 Tax=Croceicoccus bisphenolivorans TaxID=1783232 RepID=UPI000A48218D|nr:hypothetical protein [Croceicoccus bisphenolivorans]